MQYSLSHSVPLSICTSFVRALLVLLLFSASLSPVMAQSSTPIRALTPVLLMEDDESESISFEYDYAKEPSSPLSIEEVETFLVEGDLLNRNSGASSLDSYFTKTSETKDLGEAEVSFAIESATMPFEIGKEVDFEGLRVANIDPDGRIILMEDMMQPILYLRFQNIMTGNIDIKLYNEEGALMTSDKVRNMMIGTEMQLDYSDWPEGMHTLLIRLDNGTKWTKKIVKTGPFVSDF